MGLRINTNLGSLAAQRQLSLSHRELEKSMKQLASGDRFSDMTEGAGDFAIAEHLRGQIRGMRAAQMNADNATSFVQIAEGGLNEQSNILIRMRELAVQSASDTFSDTERGMMNMEFKQLGEELDRIAKTTQFGSHKVLAGDSKSYEFQVGTEKGEDSIIRYESDTNTTASALDISGLDVTDKSDARDAMSTIDEAITSVSKARANFGAVQSRLASATNFAAVQAENLEAAHSRIADTDFAQAVSEVTKQKALEQYQVAVLAQANQFPENVLRLL